MMVYYWFSHETSKFNPKQNNERCLWKMSYFPKNSHFAAKSPGLEDDFPIESGDF